MLKHIHDVANSRS